MFILEHLRTTGDARTLVLVDTFSGFTPESVDYEVANRRKRPPRSLTTPTVAPGSSITASLVSAIPTTAFDCSKVDWKEIGPIGAVFLDVDLYLPTSATLEALSDRPRRRRRSGRLRGARLVRRRLPGLPEFIDRHGLSFVRVGGKGALLMKPVAEVDPGNGPAQRDSSIPHFSYPDGTTRLGVAPFFVCSMASDGCWLTAISAAPSTARCLPA